MLSPRQSEVLRLIFDGKNDKQVAAALKIRTPTVRTHVRRLFQRLDVNDRTQLVIETFRVFRRDVEGCV
jgi:DNA-binding NarL/FixJ family response regulator